jgi:hypothetical protein
MLADKIDSRPWQTGGGSSSFVAASPTIRGIRLSSHDNRARVTHLALHIGNPIGWKGKFVEWYLGLLQISQESKFALQQEKQTFAHFPSSSCPADAMNIISRIIWWVELDYPVNPWDIKATSGYVRAE